MEQDMFEIRIHEEADLYNPLDPDGALISDEVVSYIERRYSEDEEPGEEAVIRIISDLPVDEERVRRSFRSYIESETQILTKQQRRTALKQVWLFVIGIIFIALWLFLAANTESIVVEVLSIIGSFAVWEAANIWIVEAPEMRIRKHRLSRFGEAAVVFTIGDSR